MLVCPVYDRERKEVSGRDIVIIGFRLVPKDKFQSVVDVIKQFRGRYVPAKKVWYSLEEDFNDMMKWFESGDEEAKGLYVEEDDDYEAVWRGL